jgi:hypothetical protein
MQLFASNILLLFLMGMLTGCQQRTDYAYLIQHPKQLHQALEECHTLTTMTSEEDLQCKEIKRAGADFTAMLSEQQLDPEKFGKRLLQAEYQLALTKQKLAELKRLPSEPTTAQQLADTKKLYLEKKAEIKTMLAVIGTQSPE